MCFDFKAPRRFIGIYVDEFEGQRFLEGAKPALRYHPKDRVALLIDNASDTSVAKFLKVDRRNDRSRILKLDFVGRRAPVPAGTGIIGLMMDDVIIVDRVLSSKVLQQFPGYVPDSVLVR